MIVKNKSAFGEWKFFLIHPENGSELKLPIDRENAQSISEITQIVVAQMTEFDRISGGQYTSKAKEEAASRNISFPAYVNLLIQHQICLKNGGNNICWEGGIGDTIHKMFSKIDGLVAKMPKALQSAAAAVFKAVTPSGSRTLGGCSSCGGTKTFNPNVNNLGRAGTLNKISPSNPPNEQ
jgi:hypothetical protein